MAKEKSIPCLIHIPCKMPNGDEIDDEKMNSFLEIFDRQFGGCSPLGVIPGHWVSPEGETVVEPMLRVEVAVQESQLDVFEKVARIIRRETQQKAVYVVINFQSQARLLFDDDEDDDQTRKA